MSVRRVHRAAPFAALALVLMTAAFGRSAGAAAPGRTAGRVVAAASAGPGVPGPAIASAADLAGSTDLAGSAYVPVGPARLADARQAACGCIPLDAATVRVAVAGNGGVPVDAVAAVLTITVDGAGAGGYVTAWPAGAARPETSVLNAGAGETRAGTAFVQLGEGGAVDVYVYGGGAPIVDVSGAFVPAATAAAGRFVPLAEPRRLTDTRQEPAGPFQPGEVRTVALPEQVPADATAVAVNVTATASASGLGYLTVWPAGAAQPGSSLLTTDGADQTRAAFAVVPVSAGGLQVFSAARTDVIVDVTGWFTGPSAPAGGDGLFVPQPPERALDTRTVGRQPLSPDSAICAAVGAGAAVAATVTATSTWADGYLTAWAAGTAQPATSNVNAPGASTVANAAIVARSELGVGLYSSAGSDVIVDVAGWFTGEPVAAGAMPADPWGSGLSSGTAGVPVDGASALDLLGPDPLARPPAIVTGDVCSGERGFACADGIDAGDLQSLFAGDHPELAGSDRAAFVGADYQRATKLPDGRVLWTFQDALVPYPGGVRLVHNAAIVQSGRCFRLLTGGNPGDPQAWIDGPGAVAEQHWWWPMGAAVGTDGDLHLFLMEMVEHGPTYLANPEPVATWVASLRLPDLALVRLERAPDDGTRLYGWAVTSDDEWTYLYGNCNRQFGWTDAGHDPCTADVYLARVPKGRLLDHPVYRTASGWSNDGADAVPVITASPGREVNPTQVQWDGQRFLAVTKDRDWFGADVHLEYAADAWGPWTQYGTLQPEPGCLFFCNTYFASWVPWRGADGSLIVGLSNNGWVRSSPSTYRPSFFTVPAPPA